MVKACPISGESRDNNVVRVVAALVFAIGAVIATVRGPVGGVVLLALAADFAVRGFGSPAMSPVARAAMAIARGLHLPTVRVDAAPKRFAAKIGLAFSAISGTLFLAGAPTAGLIVLGILGFCAFLEAAFGVCIGCKVYALIPHREPAQHATQP